MKRLLDRYYRLLQWLLTVLMATMIVPVSLQIASRYTGLIPRYVWTEELARFCFVWLIMLGATIAVRDGTHFHVDLMTAVRTKRSRALSQLVVHSAMLIMAGLFAVYGLAFAQFGLAHGVISLAFGLVTPPYGLCLLIACSLGEIRVTPALRDTMIVLVPLLALLSAVILFPELVLFLPRVLAPKLLH